ncbi:MAG TPA: 1-phosphofructokinase family hexose kinase [Azospirillum sp.]|nr:1-phosphofructokinase family hexose kinase [Azospirillum sp.]
MKPVVTLTLNPSIDVSCQAETVRPVRKVRTMEERFDPGGGGINVARVINELGGRSLAVYLSGGPTGGVLDDLVRAAGVRHWRVPVAGATRINQVVFERASREEFRFTAEGPPVGEGEWRSCLDDLELLDFDCLVASGSLPRGVPTDVYARVARIVAGKGARLVVDTSGDALRAVLDHGVYLAKPSIGELEQVVGRPLRESQALEAAARDLVASGGAEILAVSLGHEGALLATASGTARLRAPEVAVKSAVGAGDSFVGAMTLALVQGRSPDDALALAVAAGTATAMTPGTQLCRRTDVEALYQRLRPPRPRGSA